MTDKIELALSLGKVKGARILLKEYYQKTNKITEPKDCPECNALDGQDIDCNTCDGVGSIDVIKPLNDEELHTKAEAYLVSQYAKLREQEYPDWKDFADAYVKDDEVGMQEYKDKCLAVKAKYPKQ